MKKNLLAGFMAAVITCMSFDAFARDTDIYTRPRNIPRDDSPNVLIILDNSRSMNQTQVTVKELYDPTKTYPTVTGIVSGRIYWSTTAVPPPPNTNQWVSASNNNCTSSSDSLANNGKYGMPHMVQFNGVKWNDLAGGVNNIIECEGDPSPWPARRGGSDYTTNTSSVVLWPNFAAVQLFTSNYMNWYHQPNPPAINLSRMELAQNTVKEIIRSNPNMRVGLMVFNRNYTTNPPSTTPIDAAPHGGRVIFPIGNMTTMRIAQFEYVVDSVVADVPDDMTALSETMYEAYRYFAGKPVYYGDDDTVSFPERDPIAEDPIGTYKTPFTIDCQQAYVIIITDGYTASPKDSNADGEIAKLPGIAAKNSISYLNELAGWMYNHDVPTGNDLSAGKGRRVSTYVIGFSGMPDASKKLLEETAAKGKGTYSDVTNPNDLTRALQNSLVNILKVTTSFVAPALSVNAFNTLFNRDEVYFALFKPTGFACWPGNIKKYTLCTGLDPNNPCTLGEVLDAAQKPAIDPGTLRIQGEATSYWSTSKDGNEVLMGGAGEHVPAPADRQIYTYTGGYQADQRTPDGTVDLTASVNALADNNPALTGSMLGVAPQATNLLDATERTNIINWIRGADLRDDDANPSTLTRWQFADPLHSRPVAITYGGTQADPIVKLFVGTNDGGIRMVNESTGQEEWMFVPKEMLGDQWQLSFNNAGLHRIGVDGTPRFRVRDHTSATDSTPDGIIDPAIGDYVHLFITMRRGGRNIYALDVTPTAKVTSKTAVGDIKPKLMWVIQGGLTPGYEKLGQTWSDPRVTFIRYGINATDSEHKTVLVFGGGYDERQDNSAPTFPYPSTATDMDAMGNAIYIVDPNTGERIWWASNTGSGANLELPGMDFSIPSEVATLDADGDKATDRIYVGDTGGQMWRIDLSPLLKLNDNAGSTGYRLADVGCAGGTRPSCTNAPWYERHKFFFPPDVAQVNDSAYETPDQSKYDLVTASTGDREDPLDWITDDPSTTAVEAIHNRIYVFRDYRTKSEPASAGNPYNATITHADLYDVTSNPFQNETAALRTAIQAKKGWYIDLKEIDGTWTGEKGLAKTVIFGGSLMVTTYTPANANTALQTCAPNEGLAKLYVLNVYNGAATEDLNGDGSVTGADRAQTVGGGIPSELVTIIRPGGVSGLIGPYNPENALGGGTRALPRTKTYWAQ